MDKNKKTKEEKFQDFIIIRESLRERDRLEREELDKQI